MCSYTMKSMRTKQQHSFTPHCNKLSCPIEILLPTQKLLSSLLESQVHADNIFITWGKMQGPSLTLHRGLGLHQPVKEDYGTSESSRVQPQSHLQSRSLENLKQPLCRWSSSKYISKYSQCKKKKKIISFPASFQFFWLSQLLITTWSNRRQSLLSFAHVWRRDLFKVMT